MTQFKARAFVESFQSGEGYVVGSAIFEIAPWWCMV